MRKYADNAAKKGADRKLFFYAALAVVAFVVLFFASGIFQPAPPLGPGPTPAASPAATPEITATPASPTAGFPSPTSVETPVPQNATRVFEGPDSSLIVTDEGERTVIVLSNNADEQKRFGVYATFKELLSAEDFASRYDGNLSFERYSPHTYYAPAELDPRQPAGGRFLGPDSPTVIALPGVPPDGGGSKTFIDSDFFEQFLEPLLLEYAGSNLYPDQQSAFLGMLSGFSETESITSARDQLASALEEMQIAAGLRRAMEKDGGGGLAYGYLDEVKKTLHVDIPVKPHGGDVVFSVSGDITNYATVSYVPAKVGPGDAWENFTFDFSESDPDVSPIWGNIKYRYVQSGESYDVPIKVEMRSLPSSIASYYGVYGTPYAGAMEDLLDWPVQGIPSCGFGKYRQGNYVHDGLDIAVPAGTPVRAPADGVVNTVTSFDGCGGKVMILDHGTYKGARIMTQYLHLSSQLLSPGTAVKAGDAIAYSGGAAGAGDRCTTGPHLHFTVRKNYYPLDPLIYLKNRGYAPGSVGC